MPMLNGFYSLTQLLEMSKLLECEIVNLEYQNEILTSAIEYLMAKRAGKSDE